MRPFRRLLAIRASIAVLGFLAIVAALRWLWPPASPQGAPVVTGESLVALPWDRTVGRRFGDVAVDLPSDWTRGGGPTLTVLRIVGKPEAALTERLRRSCANPVVQRWREQWRGECLSRSGERVRGAVIREDGVWQGVESRYPDGRDARLAPRVARMLGSLRRVR